MMKSHKHSLICAAKTGGIIARMGNGGCIIEVPIVHPLKGYLCCCLFQTFYIYMLNTASSSAKL